MLEHKTYGVAQLETKGKKEGGAFEAIVSVFDNVDRENDRMRHGAFKRSLSPPSEGGRGYPAIVYAHQWTTVPIGVSAKCEEVSGVEVKDATGTKRVDGLFVDAELFVGETQLASEVYTAMSRKGGDGLPALRDFSFGYRPTADGASFIQETINGKSTRVRELTDVDLWEVGPCLVGMNPETALLGVKSGGLDLFDLLVKAGARNSATDAERLQLIHDYAVANGADCAGAKALTGPFAKALGDALGKSWDDIDSSAIYALTSMIGRGVDYISGEDDDADIARMREILAQLASMLADEIAEVEPDSGVAASDIFSMASLPTSGSESKTLATHELMFVEPLV